MKQINFSQIHHFGSTVLENAVFRHIHFPEMLTMYDSNFIQFKTMPTLDEFVEASDYLKNFHLQRKQTHVKFYLPEDEKPTQHLINYFKANDYDCGHLELYAINPKQFIRVKRVEDIVVTTVSEKNFSDYLQLQSGFDMEYGISFAEQKQALYLKNFNDEKFIQIMAFYKGEPAGSVNLIRGESTIEIDNLSVKEEFQKRGIGTRLQQYAMEHFPDKTVILVADGDDTPKEMYKKQHYQFISFKYEVLKLLVIE